MDVLILAVAFVIILLGAELFTNGIEWFGRKLELAEGAVGSVLAAVGTALPETMIPIIAILTGGGSEASHSVGVGRDPRRAVHALDAGDVRDRRRGPVASGDRSRPAGDVMPVDTEVLAHDVRYFVIAYAIAIGAAFLPLEPVWLKWIVAVVLIGIYAWYVKAHFEADPDDRRRGSRAAPLPAASIPAGSPTDPHAPRLRVVNLQVVTALSLIVARRVLLRRRGRAPGDVVRPRRGAPRARHRPDRDRAAREVQLRDLGPPGQGHALDGQHHRGDGLPVGDPDGRRPAVRRRRVALRATAAGSRSCRPGSRSSRRRRSSSRWPARTG